MCVVALAGTYSRYMYPDEPPETLLLAYLHSFHFNIYVYIFLMAFLTENSDLHPLNPCLEVYLLHIDPY